MNQEKKTSVQQEHPINGTILSDPKSDLIPISVSQWDPYIGVADGRPIVRLKALARFQHGSFRFHGAFAFSGLINSHIRYIGTKYGDHISVPFIPVGDVKVTAPTGDRSCCQAGSSAPSPPGPWSKKTGVRKVTLRLSKQTWIAIMKQLQTFLKEPELTLYIQDYSGCSRYSGEVHIKCELPHEEVVRVFFGEKWWEKNIFDVLSSRTEVGGNAFIMPKFRQMPNSLNCYLSFEGYGFCVTEHVEEIFGIPDLHKVKF